MFFINNYLRFVMIHCLSAFIVVLGLLLPSLAASQLPCDSSSKSYFYEADKLKNFPPINSDMPNDVMLGYIVADSVLKTANLVQIEDFINRQDNNIFSDSLKYFLKYFYKLSDYDPITLNQFAMESPEDYVFPNIVKSELSYFFNQNLDSGAQYDYLINSSYILHVTINDTAQIYIDSTNPACTYTTAVSATVIDTIKGKNIPNIQINPNMVGFKKLKDKIQSGTGATFVFQYCNQWPQAGGNKLLNNFVVPTKEYIVILLVRPLCEFNDKTYNTITPYLIPDFGCGMYRIENGMVMDVGNEWGLGQSVPVQQFKDRIRTYINNIENFGE